MRKRNLIWLVWLAAGAVCVISLWYGYSQRAEPKRVVARINNYVMTLEDFEDGIAHSPYRIYRKRDLGELLDLAVRKQVLIQEAEREGLDKSKSFMKTIERYWRQTLIKELLEKQSRIIYENVGKSKDKQKEAFKAWEDELYKEADIEIYPEVLEEFEEKK